MGSEIWRFLSAFIMGLGGMGAVVSASKMLEDITDFVIVCSQGTQGGMDGGEATQRATETRERWKQHSAALSLWVWIIVVGGLLR